jgi:3-hydroxyisobutyrate dehydrogenase-like beta-hydroxyacid dehydrogenase
MTAVAVIGAGRMGAAMAVRLAGGHQVTVYNRTRARAEAVVDSAAGNASGSVADTARDAAAGADVVIVSLADDAAVDAVYRGADGLAAGVRDGAVVLETSTVHPGTVRSLARLVEQQGATLLDAPVSGSVPVAERGELTFMVGGDAGALERVRPVLDVLAARVFHLGGRGTGATMKLAVNAVVFALNQAVSEALVLAEKAGVAREAAYDVFAASAVAAPFVHYKRAAFERPDDAPVAFSLDLVAKDMTLINDLAVEAGARMDQLEANRAVVQEALKGAFGPRDMSALAVLLRAQNRD